MNLHDFQTLLLNRNEIEKTLEVNLQLSAGSKELYLDDYAMLSVIPLEDVISIFLGLDPMEQKKNINNPRYFTIYKAIETAVRRGEVEAEVEQDFDINGNEIQFDILLSHETAKAWAKTHGLKWNVPPYQQIISDNMADSTQATTILQQSEEIKRLQAENAELKAQLQTNAQPQQGIMDYGECSIYGHTTDDIKAIFGTIKRFWINHDINLPDTIANKEVIEDWIESNYPNVSQTNRVAIQKITRPKEAKTIGRK